MKERKNGWAASGLVLALLAGCGSGGSGPLGDPIPVGPSSGQGEGFGASQESTGRSFGSPDYRPEGSGPGLDGPGGGSGGPGGPGGPGGGGGASRQEVIEICRSGCDRAAQACGIDATKCKAECAGVPDPAAHPCGNEIRAVAECTKTATIKCEDDDYTVEGCDAELFAFLTCMTENDDDGQGPGGEFPGPGGEFPGPGGEFPGGDFTDDELPGEDD